MRKSVPRAPGGGMLTKNFNFGSADAVGATANGMGMQARQQRGCRERHKKSLASADGV